VGIVDIDPTRIKQIAVIVSIILIVASPFVSNLHRDLEPGYVAVDESPIGGSVGYTISKTPVSPQRDLFVYKGNVNDSNAGWDVQYGRDYRIHSDVEGVILELGLNREATDSSPMFFTYFHGSPTLPLMNYSEICFTVKTTVIEGAADVSLGVVYWAWPLNEWIEVGENSTHLGQDQTEDLILRPPLEDAFNFTSEWIIRTSMNVKIQSTGYSRILIESVSISVKSNEDLYPVTIDIQAPDGESLFANPYTNLIGTPLSGSHPYGTKFIAMQLTRTGNVSDSSPLGPQGVNETLYLAEGVYNGTAGWAGYTGYISERDSVGSLSFVVGQTEANHLAIRIPTFRLFIDIQPQFAYSRVSILTGYFDYVIDYPLKNAEYLYMSKVSSFSVFITPLFYEANLGVDYLHYHNGPPRAAIGVQTNGESNVLVTVVFSQFAPFGIIIDFGQIIAFLGGGILVFLLIYEGSKKSFAGFWEDSKVRTNLLPVSLYYLSMFLPWVTYGFTTRAIPPTDVNGLIIVPILTSFWWSAGSRLTPAPSSYLFPNILIMIAIYWVPILYLSYLIVTKRETISYSLYESDIDDVTAVGFVALGPFLLGCYYLALCISGVCLPSIGLFTALLTFPSWFVAHWLRKRRDNISKIGN